MTLSASTSSARDDLVGLIANDTTDLDVDARRLEFLGDLADRFGLLCQRLRRDTSLLEIEPHPIDGVVVALDFVFVLVG